MQLTCIIIRYRIKRNRLAFSGATRSRASGACGGLPRRDAVGAVAFDEEIDLPRMEAGGRFDFLRRRHVVDAGEHGASDALKMRVLVRLPAGPGAEAPHLVGAGHAVHQLVFSQPFQHPLKGDRSKRRSGELIQNSMVRQRAGLSHQKTKRGDPLAGHPGACGADQVLGLLGNGSLHESLFNIEVWSGPSCHGAPLSVASAPAGRRRRRYFNAIKLRLSL